MPADAAGVLGMVGHLSAEQSARIIRADPAERQMGGFGLIYDDRGHYRSPALVERVGVNHPVFGSHWRLTPLGLQVRAALAAAPPEAGEG